MKKYLFESAEINLIKLLSSQNPIRIWRERISFVFEYESFFIELQIQLAEEIIYKDAPNQYVMMVKIKKEDFVFEPSIGADLLSDNEKINHISIVRTVLCFNKSRQSKEHKNYFIDESFLINPNSSSTVIAEKKYLVDVGLLIENQNKTLNCFVMENDDDFSRNSFFDYEDLKSDKANNYEFVDIRNVS